MRFISIFYLLTLSSCSFKGCSTSSQSNSSPIEKEATQDPHLLVEQEAISRKIKLQQIDQEHKRNLLEKAIKDGFARRQNIWLTNLKKWSENKILSPCWKHQVNMVI